MGSSEVLMYFNKDGIVVGMCVPDRVLGLELTSPFVEIVRELGSCIDDSFVSCSSSSGKTNIRGVERSPVIIHQ